MNADLDSATSNGEESANGQEIETELLPEVPLMKRKKLSKSNKAAIEWVILIVSALTIALLIKTFLFQAFVIPSESMETTLHGCAGCDNDRILVNKLSYRFHDVNRGDIVVFEAPKNRQHDGIKDYVKRVIGLPGDYIELGNNEVLIDGEPLIEPYVNPECAHSVADGLIAHTVPPGHVFVMGDNRCKSADSRSFGNVEQGNYGDIPEDTIIGRAFVRIWPFGRFKFL